MKPASATRCRPTRHFLFAAILCVAGQLGLFSTSLILAREESSAAAHAEQNGTALHHAHNEATCAACAARSLQAAVHSVPPVARREMSLLVLSRKSAQPLTNPKL